MVGNRTMSASSFHEEHQVPFCSPFLCLTAFANATGHGQKVLWSCVPAHCKVNVLVFLGFIVTLAAMTIAFNCLILGINLAAKTRQERKQRPAMSNYAVYVVFLAVADLLVGVVVLPLCLVHFYLEFMVNELPRSTPAPEGRSVNNQAGFLEMSGNFNTEAPAEKAVVTNQDAAGTIRSVLGVFTHFTLFVSVYTLITASADRLYAATYSRASLSQPPKRTAGQTKTGWWRETISSVKRSTVAVSIVWVLGIVFALLPVVWSNELHFRHVGHIFAAMTSDRNYNTAVRWYLLTLVIPLLGIWFLNAAICLKLWRRKRQLVLHRKRSLRRKHSPDPSTAKSAPPTSNVFEPRPAESCAVLKYPASRWNRNTSIDDNETRPQLNTFHPIYRNKGSCDSKTSVRSPPGMRPQSFHWEARGSTFRRKVSSIRRAKEMLRVQSCEANITKTLSIVVVAFTIAVLPLIVTLSTISVRDDYTLANLNSEVTALSLSLLLLFSNSLVNCVIYGARLRDFRKSLSQLFQKFVNKIRTTLCCCCVGSKQDSYSTEIVNGVFLVAKNQRTELYQRSPSLSKSYETFEKVNRFPRISSEKPHSRKVTVGNEKNSNKNNAETTASPTRNLCRSIPNRFITSVCGTDPKSNSKQQYSGKNKASQIIEAADAVNNNEFAKEISRTLQTARNTATPDMIQDEKHERPMATSRYHNQTADEEPRRSSTAEPQFKTTRLHRSDYDNEKSLSQTSPNTILDQVDRSQDIEIDRSIDFSLDIDFSQFSHFKRTL